MAQALWDSVRDHGITSLRVLQHGEVVYTAGAQDVPLPIHSVRKSIVSALFGQLVDDGLVRLDTTLADLGIVESPELTPMEASATLEHLLTSSSGVYLPLKFDPSFDVFANTVAPWPTRGSSVPGTRFHYSNWDFNVLGEIYQRVSSTALFVAVDRQLAQPLNFRDWDPLKHSHLYYAPDPWCGPGCQIHSGTMAICGGPSERTMVPYSRREATRRWDRDGRRCPSSRPATSSSSPCPNQPTAVTSRWPFPTRS
jgi:CubicO group peptidase (beta-lactamase class C family)